MTRVNVVWLKTTGGHREHELGAHAGVLVHLWASIKPERPGLILTALVSDQANPPWFHTKDKTHDTWSVGIIPV